MGKFSGSDESQGVVVPGNRLRPLSPHVYLSVSLVQLTVQAPDQPFIVA